MEPPILETRPCPFYGPVKSTAIPQHGPQNNLKKLYHHGHKISKRFTQTDYSNTKAHTHLIK